MKTDTSNQSVTVAKMPTAWLLPANKAVATAMTNRARAKKRHVSGTPVRGQYCWRQRGHGVVKERQLAGFQLALHLLPKLHCGLGSARDRGLENTF
jgi:hypothetical protein